jgi:hypothetical protein
MSDTKDCNECDGEGRWFDASHSATRKCNTCNGTGKKSDNPYTKLLKASEKEIATARELLPNPVLFDLVRKMMPDIMAEMITGATKIEQQWDKNNRYDEAMEIVKDEVPKV